MGVMSGTLRALVHAVRYEERPTYADEARVLLAVRMRLGVAFHLPEAALGLERRAGAPRGASNGAWESKLFGPGFMGKEQKSLRPLPS